MKFDNGNIYIIDYLLYEILNKDNTIIYNEDTLSKIYIF